MNGSDGILRFASAPRNLMPRVRLPPRIE